MKKKEFNEEEIFSIIKGLLIEKLELEENESFKINKTTKFDEISNETDFDSLDKVEFLMEIEQTFGISIPDDAIDDLNTLGDIEAIVKKLLPL